MQVTIRTNNQPRPILWACDLTEKEKTEFDYLNLEEGDGSFFRYKGQVYDLGEFVRVEANACEHNAPFQAWHGVQSDSYFSGVLVRYTDECESVIVGQYFS